MSKLNVSAADGAQGTVVTVVGEASVEEVDDLERELQALAAARGAVYVLDLSGLSFAASLAIGCLLRFRNRVMSAGGRVALAEVRPMVAESFRRAQLQRVFAMFGTVEAALEGEAPETSHVKGNASR